MGLGPKGNTKKWPGYVPLKPLRDWLLAEEAKLAADPRVERAAEELARRLETDERYLYRWKNGLNMADKPARLVPFLTVIELLHAWGPTVWFNDLYPCWCNVCGKHIPGGRNKSGMCNPCLVASGGRKIPHDGQQPRSMSEAVMVRAQVLYEEHGLSFRKIAARLYDQTTYANEKVFAVALHKQSRRRGWKVRDRIEATVAASYKHGAARRRPETEEDKELKKAYKHRMRVRNGQARGVRCHGTVQRAGERHGKRCQRAAAKGSLFCRQHDPELREELLAHLEEMRARSPRGAGSTTRRVNLPETTTPRRVSFD